MDTLAVAWRIVLILIVWLVTFFFCQLVLQLLGSWWREEFIPWLDRRRRSRQVSEDTMRQIDQRHLQQAVRKLVEDDRRRRPSAIVNIEDGR